MAAEGDGGDEKRAAFQGFSRWLTEWALRSEGGRRPHPGRGRPPDCRRLLSHADFRRVRFRYRATPVVEDAYVVVWLVVLTRRYHHSAITIDDLARLSGRRASGRMWPFPSAVLLG